MTPLKFYLAGASVEAEDCAKRIRALEAEGFICTHDWTQDVMQSQALGLSDFDLSPTIAARAACADLQAVRDADFVWLCIPPQGRAAGAWVEYGYALGLRKNVIVSGEKRRSIFLSQALNAFDTHDEAHIWLVSELAIFTK